MQFYKSIDKFKAPQINNSSFKTEVNKIWGNNTNATKNSNLNKVNSSVFNGYKIMTNKANKQTCGNMLQSFISDKLQRNEVRRNIASRQNSYRDEEFEGKFLSLIVVKSSTTQLRKQSSLLTKVGI